MNNIMKVKTVLVEPDEGIRERFHELLLIYNLFEIIGEFGEVDAANDFICINEVDAVFINAESGDPRFSGDGTYLAMNLSQNCPDLLMVMYAPAPLPSDIIFQSGCVESFVLPFDSMTLQRIVNRIRYLFGLLQYKKQSVNRSVMIKTKSGYQLTAIDSILFIERVGRKNRMVTVEGREVVLSGYSLDELERMLESSNFYRCYQSFIVNLSKVSFIKVNNETKNYALQFENYAGEVMLSRDKYTEVLQLLKEKFAKISL